MKTVKSVKQSKAIKFELKQGKKTVGRAYLYLVTNNLHKKPYGLLEDVFVEDEYRGRGLGTKLISQVIQEAKKRKCYKLIATSRASRKSVHKLYQKFGFKKWGVEFRMNF